MIAAKRWSCLLLIAALAASCFSAPALAQLPAGQNLAVGNTPITGTCPSGYDLYNNAGVLGCQTDAGNGTVTSVSVATANGLSGSVANPTTTPAITLTLGAITPSSATIGAGSAITSSGPGGALGTGAFAAAYVCPNATGAALGCAQAGAGIGVASGVFSNSATEHVSFQPGLVTSISNSKGAFYKFSKASTVDNVEASASSFSCTGNPTVTMYECATSSTCSTPTTIGSATVTAAGAVVDGSVASAAISAGDYVAFAVSAGTCVSLDVQMTAQVHQN